MTMVLVNETEAELIHGFFVRLRDECNRYANHTSRVRTNGYILQIRAAEI